MQADRRAQRHGVDVALLQQLLEGEEAVGHVELRGHGFGAPGDRVADRLQRHTVLHVILAQVRHDTALRDRSRADDSHSNDI